MPKRVVLAGGTGFIGQAIGRRLRERGWEVVVLTRASPRRRGDGVREVLWSAAPVSAGRGNPEWFSALDGAQVVVNLAGRSIDCAPTAKNRRSIRASRLDAVRALAQAFRACAQPPAAWIQCSAVGFYGHEAAARCDESAPAGSDFLADVCREWEQLFAQECPAGVRPVVLRLGVVFGRKAGAFPQLAKAVRSFVGGTAGSGRQGVSWIHLSDVEEIFLRAVETELMRGTYNVSAPEPVANADLMRALRTVLRRPWAPPAPTPFLWLLARFILRTNPDLILHGQFAVPARLEAEGYRFKYGRLAYTLADLVDRK